MASVEPAAAALMGRTSGIVNLVPIVPHSRPARPRIRIGVDGHHAARAIPFRPQFVRRPRR
jgi:hypothetical protein